MEELTIGKTRIPVKLKVNQRLKKIRLSVDQNGALVETPNDFPVARVVAFIEKEKEWVFTQWEDLRGKRFQNAWPERFETGAKVLFLGRMNPLVITQGSQNHVTYSVRGFQVEIKESREDKNIQALMIDYFQEFLEKLISELIVSQPSLKSGNAVKVRFTKRQDRWAYCDESNTLHIGWDLAFLPKKLVEYVLLHELCHLEQRNHSQDFWQLLRSVLPDYEERKKGLSEFEASIEY